MSRGQIEASRLGRRPRKAQARERVKGEREWANWPPSPEKAEYPGKVLTTSELATGASSTGPTATPQRSGTSHSRPSVPA